MSSGLSAAGHIAYLLVRMGTVFRLGSHYVTDDVEREKWPEVMSERQKLKILLSAKYPWFLFEMTLTAFLIVYLGVLRLTTQGYFSEECGLV